jgi:PPOX class probable F420-dependent enzyme
MKQYEEDYLRLKERGFLVTLSEKQRPTIIPICFAYQSGTIYTAIDKKPKGKKLARLTNIASNKIVAFLVDNYSENWNKLSYLLIHGVARIVTVKNEEARAKDLLKMKYPQYRRLKLDGAKVIAIDVKESKFWLFKEPSYSNTRNP